jgi:NAD(P)-dependent dehydrogenase (short-subunit alcohol dehydrogenase family)
MPIRADEHETYAQWSAEFNCAPGRWVTDDEDRAWCLSGRGSKRQNEGREPESRQNERKSTDSQQFANAGSTALDVTERTRIEEVLRRSEEYLRLTIDAIPGVAWCARPDRSNEFSVKCLTGMILSGRNMMTEQKPLISGFGPRTTAEEALAGADLQGKVAIVTGGHAGLGLETTRVLAGAGATVVIGSRDLKKAQLAVGKMKNVEVSQLDLASPSSIDRFANQFLSSNRALDLLINNAGIMATPLMRDDRGYEMQFATNHLGHFQLTARLWEGLKKSGSARVIALTSLGHRMGQVDLNDPNFNQRPYDKWVAYGQSKSANSLFVVELDKRGQEHGIRAFAVHPGGILTDLGRYMTEEDFKAFGIYRENGVLKGPEWLKSVEQGSATTVWCAVSPQLNHKGGVYCEDCDIAPMVPADSTLRSGVRPWAVDKAGAEALWILSEKLAPTAP